MPNPLDTERAFRNLLNALQYPASTRQRLQQICDFFAGIQGLLQLHESYVVELATLIPGFLKHATFSGTDPEYLLRFHECLNGCVRDVPQVAAIPEFSGALNQLKREAAAILTFLGEEERALRVLDGLEPISEFANPKQFSLQVAVVERDISGQRSDGGWGALRRIVLTPLGTSSSGNDEVHLDIAVFGADASSENLLKSPLSAVRMLKESRNPHLQTSFLRAQVYFEGEQALHKGSSANLALAALVYCAILAVTMQRDLYRCLPTTVITGAIDEAGHVLPVDLASISPKTEAAFFSNAETLVVPKEQLESFEQPAAELNKAYPRRNLTVLGVASLEELFFDRRITEHVRVSLPRHGVRRVWKWRRPLAAGTILGLGLLLLRFLYGPLDKEPSSYRLEGEYLEILNQSNQVLERMVVGTKTVENLKITHFQTVTPAPVAIADVDGDGTKEILWIEFTSESGRSLALIKCKTLGEDTLRWSHRLKLNLDFPNNADVTSSDFVASHILVDDFDANGKVEVLVNYRHEMFPGVVQLLDASTGAEISHYLHIGHFADMKERDLDGDGVKEILLTGTNNAFREACLVVLDPRKLQGHSPLTLEYEVRGYERGVEKAYVRIPCTPVGREFRAAVKSNLGTQIRFTEEDQSFTVQVLDVNIPPTDGNISVTATIWLKFGYDLSFKRVSTGDDYDILYDHLVGQGKLKKVPRMDALANYGKTLLYLEGEGWRTP